jgi:hypothetical protein
LVSPNRPFSLLKYAVRRWVKSLSSRVLLFMYNIEEEKEDNGGAFLLSSIMGESETKL